MHRLIVGLTGNIATGKSTVLQYLRAKGAYVIDADTLTHQAMQPGGPAYAAIIEAFGPTVIKEDGTVDRTALGRIVFSDPLKLRQLEEIVHPAVFVLAQEELARTDASLVVVEAIKLLESQRLLTLCSEVWVVTADADVQLRRLISQRSMTEAEARQRMAAQSAQEEKVKHATRVITNNGTPEALYRQLDGLWNELLAAA